MTNCSESNQIGRAKKKNQGRGINEGLILDENHSKKMPRKIKLARK